jgi:hypothetical protein
VDAEISAAAATSVLTAVFLGMLKAVAAVAAFGFLTGQ